MCATSPSHMSSCLSERKLAGNASSSTEARIFSVAALPRIRLNDAIGPYTWQDVYDAVNEAPALPNMLIGQPGATKGKAWPAPSSSKYLKLRGKSANDVYTPFSATVRDSVESARERGWAGARRLAFPVHHS